MNKNKILDQFGSKLKTKSHNNYVNKWNHEDHSTNDLSNKSSHPPYNFHHSLSFAAVLAAVCRRCGVAIVLLHRLQLDRIRRHRIPVDAVHGALQQIPLHCGRGQQSSAKVGGVQDGVPGAEEVGPTGSHQLPLREEELLGRRQVHQIVQEAVRLTPFRRCPWTKNFNLRPKNLD